MFCHAPERRAVLLDITCDSDGAIDHYVDGDGIATTMLPPVKSRKRVFSGPFRWGRGGCLGASHPAFPWVYHNGRYMGAKFSDGKGWGSGLTGPQAAHAFFRSKPVAKSVPAIFLDRDGTINVDHDWGEVVTR